MKAKIFQLIFTMENFQIYQIHIICKKQKIGIRQKINCKHIYIYRQYILLFIEKKLLQYL